MLMRRAGISGLPGSRRRRHLPSVPTAADLVDRQFYADGPNRIWVMDFERHEALSDRGEVRDLFLRAVAAAC